MKIRNYKDEDCEAVSGLFYETVHTVNAKDYTKEQLFAWASDNKCLTARRSDLINQNTLIAESDGKIVGFGSIDKSGCLDLLFVHKNYQKQGVATALCAEMEKDFDVIRTYSSVTARPFFEKRGYEVVKSQEVERSGIKLKRFEMVKINKI
ncbi:MAG: GNAT family N-acetyltransferase [Candidatus Coproplasma sp.]